MRHGSTNPEISRRDLRMRSREIMDVVERGQAFTVTRDGREIGWLVPLPPRRFVPRSDFVATSAAAPTVDPARLRDDQADGLDLVLDDPGVR